MQRILVTGASGKVGSRLVPRLAARDGVAVRAFVRDADRAAPLRACGAELARGTFEDAGAVRAAVDGVDTLVLITAASPAAADQAGAFLAAARAAGVRKIVRLSVFRAAADGPADVTRLHGRTDDALRRTGLTYVILRPPFFMQNLVGMAAPSIVRDGTLPFGVGDGRLGLIDLRDVVECVEAGAVSDACDDEVVTLTGPESLGFGDVAGRLALALGRPVRYVPVSPEAVAQAIRALGLGDWYAGVMRDLCRAYGENWGDVTTNGVARLTGHPPRSVDAFAHEVFAPALRHAGQP
jgi:uncharacterized protein YbjT (DUF2867 family)